MYDFILFEISKYPNHYKDIVITAKMLKSQGYSVAIYDYYKEKDECANCGFPIITSENIHPQPSIFSKFSNRLISSLGHLIDRFNISKYQSSVLKELKGQCHNLYFGTYCDEVSRRFINNLDPNTNYFTWVVKSSLLSKGAKRSLNWGTINYAFIRNLVIKSRIIFFVSNDIIKAEFRSLKFPEDRLVLRPERFVEDISDNSIEHDDFTLLTIGSLRRSKRIELSLTALKILNDQNIHITIAGRVQGDEKYEKLISKVGSELHNFKRINHRLSEEEYNAYLDSSDFMVLCDEKTDSTITNGTLSEALMHHLPVIVPNYEPYKSLVENFGIGIMYNPKDINTLVEAIKIAKRQGKEAFKLKIDQYLKTITLKNVSSLLGNELKKLNICPK